MAEFRLPAFGHGGDYNPDQWLSRPDVLQDDIRFMKEASVNLVSIGIFAWAALEPEEGRYTFDWLGEILDNFHKNGISAFLATPSGARPAWMSKKYPEVLRYEHGVKMQHGNRHNHCFTSSVYRSFVTKMNTRLAEEFGRHPAVVGWHISNEYSGECHCENCQKAFREWLKARYQTLHRLNEVWWTAFWSKTFSDWDEIRSPERNGETSLTGLTLDWQRFVSHQTMDFIKCETEPIRRLTPNLPVTINTMQNFTALSYPKFDGVVDFMGYDCYSLWGSAPDYRIAVDTAFTYDSVRGYLNKPWSLMESTPSQVNWHEVCKIKRPGIHMLSCVQAVAHGADTVMMFQWRKGRGGPEKFHGAVIGHDMTNKTRVFREVSEVGALLKKIQPIVNSEVKSECALIYDFENYWALTGAQGPVKDKQYHAVLMSHYEALTKNGINVDVIDSEKPFDAYKLICAPYLYMVKPGVSEKLERFVKNGGTLVLGYFSGIADENDLCFLGGAPGPLKPLAGVWAEETDALYADQKNSIVISKNEYIALQGEYECGFMLDILNLEGAQAVGVYGSDYYEGSAALTVHTMGSGETWYIAARTEQRFLDDLYRCLIEKAGVRKLIAQLPAGVIACEREKDGEKYLFVMNFSGEAATVSLPAGVSMVTGDAVSGEKRLAQNGFEIMKRA